jgi:hypothetical protein
MLEKASEMSGYSQRLAQGPENQMKTVFFFFSFFFFFFFFWQYGVLTPGRILGRQVRYHLSHSTSPSDLYYIKVYKSSQVCKKMDRTGDHHVK